jgi:hypothetical protein
MKTMKQITLAAILASFAPAALANDNGPCSVCDDPTFPAIESHAPAIAIAVDGGETAVALRADPTFPDAANASPAVALQHVSGERPALDSLNPVTSDETYAAVMGASQERRVAKR